MGKKKRTEYPGDSKPKYDGKRMKIEDLDNDEAYYKLYTRKDNS